MMNALLDRELLVVTGKGGVGRTTMSAALGVLSGRSGRSTLIVEVGEQSRLPGLFGVPAPAIGTATSLAAHLECVTIDPDAALLRWLQRVGGRAAGRLLASSSTFQYFAAAAPGARELITMVAIWEFTSGSGNRGAREVVIVDAPASGHALGMLGSPSTFGSIARVGPIASHSREVQQLVQDPSRSGLVAVAIATEMAVTETLELDRALFSSLGRGLDRVIVNQLLPKRFTNEELERAELAANGAKRSPAAAGAVAAVRDLETRARAQHAHVSRLRRDGQEAATVPFLWEESLEEAAIDRIADPLARQRPPFS